MRMNKDLRVWAPLIVLVMVISTRSLAEQPWCKYRDVSFKEQTLVPIEISQLIVASIQKAAVGNNPAFASAIENSVGQATVVNESSRKIVSYLLVVEFVMDDGKKVSMPLFNLDTKSGSTLQEEFSSWVRAHGKRLGPVLPHGTPTDLTFSSPVMLASCPKTAALSAVSVQYDDGELLERISHSVYLQPVILSAPLRETEAMDRWGSETATGTIDVESDGHGEAVEVSSQSLEVVQFVQRAVRAWIFHPAMSDGSPTKGQIRFILSIGELPSDWAKQRSIALSRSSDGMLVAIHIVPPLPMPRTTKWVVEIGGSRF